ncbi:MAG: hypothetical protein AAGE94_24255 [Acidobacteriota bacterium]
MKLRSLLPFLLLALIAIAGTALAVDADLSDTPAPVEQPAVDEVQPDILPEVLPELRPELTEANGACCVADCADEWEACSQNCSTPSCFQACGQEFAACRQAC